MPDLGIYWIAVVWCWIVIPHFIPVICEYTTELWTIQAIGLVGLVMCGTMSMPEGHPHHMDLSGWLVLFALGYLIRIFTKLNLGG